MGGIAAVVLVVIVWALLVPGADWLARHDVGAARGSVLATARDAARGRLLTLGAGLLAAGALLFTARSFTLSREGQVTDRYTKAIEQLGSDKLDVRIGGIYALERIAGDSAKDHPTVMEVLTAFIREHSREQGPPSGPSGQEQTRPTLRADIQAAAAVIGRRDKRRDIQQIDLRGTNLRGGADLGGADLSGADLSGADLGDANLSDANLSDAKLTRAKLTRANLSGADLSDAKLSDAKLDGAVLTRTDLTRADLSDAKLSDAKLDGAVLTRADLTRADLSGAFLGRANLGGAVLTRADLTGAALAGAFLGSANLGGAVLTHADLTRVDLTNTELTGVKWPDEVPAPAGWTAAFGPLERAGGLSEVTDHYP
jgi:uncharacterized protein YjbI with pentapeptide repeats